VSGTHPGFDRAERVLDCLAPLAHFLWMLVEPALHRLKNVLMLPSGDPSLLAGGAAVLDGAGLAGIIISPVAAQDQPIFLVRIVVSATAMLERKSCRPPCSDSDRVAPANTRRTNSRARFSRSSMKHPRMVLPQRKRRRGNPCGRVFGGQT
jgi:hypothetical protein